MPRYPGSIRQDARPPDASAAIQPPSTAPSIVALPTGFHGDRIAVDPDSGSALVLDVANGVLMPLDWDGAKSGEPIHVSEFPKDRSSATRFSSDLVASGGVAHVSDPTAGVVHRLRY